MPSSKYLALVGRFRDAYDNIVDEQDCRNREEQNIEIRDQRGNEGFVVRPVKSGPKIIFKKELDRASPSPLMISAILMSSACATLAEIIQK